MLNVRNIPLLLALSLLLGRADSALAHAVGAECRLLGDKVEVEAYFDDDSPARNAWVTVWDSSKKEIAAGRTDAKGQWGFPVPAPGTYQVAIDAGAGHRTTVRLRVPAENEPKDDPLAHPDAPPGDPTPLVSDGLTREEFTRFPWEKIALGLGLVALAGLLARGLARQTRP